MSWTIDSGGIAGTPFLNNDTYGNYTIPYWTFTGNNGKFVSKSAGDEHRTQSATTQSDLGFKSGGSDFATLVSIANETPSGATGVTVSASASGTLMASYSGSKTKVIVYLGGAGGAGGSGRSGGLFVGWLGGAGGGGGGRLIAYSVSYLYYICAGRANGESSWVADNNVGGSKYLIAGGGGNGGQPPNVSDRGSPGSAGGFSSTIGSLYCASNGGAGASAGAGGGSAGASMTYWSGSFSFSAFSGGGVGSDGGMGGGGGASGANGAQGGGGSGNAHSYNGSQGSGGGGGDADAGGARSGGSGGDGEARFYW